MRDALSIMDKMVSFSDGKITYADTLEHLNILDEGYYFKLLAAIRDQQLAEALLIYDEINRKAILASDAWCSISTLCSSCLVAMVLATQSRQGTQRAGRDLLCGRRVAQVGEQAGLAELGRRSSAHL